MARTWENQKVLWPLLQVVVPLVHGARLASIQPVGGCLPPEYCGSSASIEFLAGGMIMLLWAWAVATSAVAAAARIIGVF